MFASAPFRRGLIRSTFMFMLLSTVPLWADSEIPLNYVPHRVMVEMKNYVPGAQFTKAEIDSSDTWGTTFECEFFRGRHKGSIKLSEGGHLLDVSQEVDPEEVPRTVIRAVSREARGGSIRKASLDEDDGRLVYKVEAYYGQSNAKVKLKITRNGSILEREFD